MAVIRWACRFLSLSGGVEVFGLGQAGQLILVARQTAEEDGAADAEDGCSPAEAIGPGVVIVALKDQLVEFAGVDDQSNDLENNCRERERRKRVLYFSKADFSGICTIFLTTFCFHSLHFITNICTLYCSHFQNRLVTLVLMHLWIIIFILHHCTDSNSKVWKYLYMSV